MKSNRMEHVKVGRPMPLYQFEARDSNGSEVRDLIEAPSEEEARQLVMRMGYSVTRITEVAGPGAESAPEPAGAKSKPDSSAEFELSLDDSGVRPEPAERASETGPEAPALDEPGPAPAPPGGGPKIGQVLVDLGFIDEDQMWDVLDEAKTTGRRTGQVAVSRGLITEEQLVQALGERHGLKVVDLQEVKPSAEALALVPETMATVYQVLPLSVRDKVLTIAIGDPTNLSALQDLRNLLPDVNEVVAMLAPAAAITAAIATYYAGEEETILDIIQSLEADLPRPKETSIDLASLIEIQEAEPVRKLVNMVMLLAIRDKASDIHFEPFEGEYKMRYRCDGVLYEMVPPPRHLATKIADRLKVMANLDTTERRRPQHGRIRLNVGGNPIDLRVSVLPTVFGENIALRLFDRTVTSLDLSRLGIDPSLLARFREVLHGPNGIILVAGPSGAGKTATLYSALNELNEITGKIVTAEDPIECEIDGVVQCQVGRDSTCADVLASVPGQEPDVIAVGEIGDEETARAACAATLGGRLVIATLDATDAASAFTRIRGMGLEPPSIAAAVKAVLAQRLVRKICADCRTEFEPSQDQLLELNLRPEDVKGRKFYYGKGCDRCNNTGHRGRSGIFELVAVDDEIRELIASDASLDELRRACRTRGTGTLRGAGLKAVFDGVTTIDEVVRQTVLVGQDQDPSDPRIEDHHGGGSRNGAGG
jgi:type IV pilus assembly protein PilB